MAKQLRVPTECQKARVWGTALWPYTMPMSQACV